MYNPGESNTIFDCDLLYFFRQSFPSLILLHDQTPVYPCMSFEQFTHFHVLCEFFCLYYFITFVRFFMWTVLNKIPFEIEIEILEKCNHSIQKNFVPFENSTKDLLKSCYASNMRSTFGWALCIQFMLNALGNFAIFWSIVMIVWMYLVFLDISIFYVFIPKKAHIHIWWNLSKLKWVAKNAYSWKKTL